MQATKKISSPLSIWITTLRPKTLTASIIPFLAGTALSYAHGAFIHWRLLFCAVISALFIQTAVNFLNDASDFEKGTDRKEGLGPRRAIHEGLISSKQMFGLGLISLLLAFLFGLPLMNHGGFPIVALLGASMLMSYAYTAGPFPLAYKGLGDIFVLIFYGWIVTFAAYWLQTGKINLESFLLGTQIGLLCTAIIIVNNARDAANDARHNKKTLAVRFGLTFSRWEIAFCSLFPFVLNLIWLSWGYTSAAWLSMLTLPIAILLVKKIATTPPSSEYNKFLGLAGLLHLSFGFLMSIGFLFYGN